MSRVAAPAARVGPPLLAGLFLVLLTLQLHDVLVATYLNGDAASGPVLADQLGQRGDGRTVLGEYLWAEALVALRLLSGLPGHRELQQLLPLVVYALVIRGVAWSVAQAAGRRRALLVAAVLACPSPLVFDALATLNFHGLALAHTVLLGVGLVLLVRDGERWSGRRLALWAVGLGVLTAPGVATDQLVLVGGLPPFLLAVSGLGALGHLRRREFGAAWGSMVVAGALAVAIRAVLAGERIETADKELTTSTFSALAERLELFLDCFGSFFHGATGQALDGRTGLQYVVAVLAAGLLLTTGVAVRRAIPRVRELPPVTAALGAFWAAVLLLLALAFGSTSAAADGTSVRYVLATWPAVLVLLAVLLPARASLGLLATTAAVVAALALYDLAHGDYTDDPSGFVRGDDAAQLAELVRTQRLDHGYAGYWTAANLSYATRLEAKVRPVGPCAAFVCPFRLHRLDAWYAPRAGVRTFYVVDGAAPEPRAPQPPPEWGAEAQQTVGRLTVYVYPYDVASRLGPPSD